VPFGGENRKKIALPKEIWENWEKYGKMPMLSIVSLHRDTNSKKNAPKRRIFAKISPPLGILRR